MQILLVEACIILDPSKHAIAARGCPVLWKGGTLKRPAINIFTVGKAAALGFLYGYLGAYGVPISSINFHQQDTCKCHACIWAAPIGLCQPLC
jgi:hypothetical protein